MKWSPINVAVFNPEFVTTCDYSVTCDIEQNIESVAEGCCTAGAESKQEIIQWVESDGDG